MPASRRARCSTAPRDVLEPASGDAFLLMTSVNGKDATDEFELTDAEIEGRRQARSTLSYLREHVPGFAGAHFTQLAPWIGVRETRRVLGEAILTGDDVLTGRAFPDAISWGGGPLDRHEGHSVSLVSPQRPFAVPYRCLLPPDVDNVLVTGRAVSADSAGMSGLRHMGGVMPLGEAAGAAATLSLARDVRPRDLPVEVLRGRLRDAGAIVDSPVQKCPDPSPEAIARTERTVRAAVLTASRHQQLVDLPTHEQARN